MRAWGAAVLAIGLLGAGCADSGEESSGASPSTTSPASVADGCGAATAEVGTERLIHPYSGVDREVERVVPPAYDATTPYPLIVSLHGFTSSIEQIDLFSALPEAAAERGYVLLTPQGEPATVSVGERDISASMWNLGLDGGAVTAGVQDDVGFIVELLDSTESELCIDPDRIYLAGNSNGAGMAAALACAAPGRFAAIAPVSGVNLARECEDPAPVSMIAFHGDADPLVPYAGGPHERTGRDSPAVERRVTSWAEAAGCGSEPDVSMPFDDVEFLRWAGCDQGLDVELYRVVGGGHTWPGMLNYLDADALGEIADDQALVEVADLDVAEIAGHMTVNIEATRLMMDFFDTHARP